MEEVCNEGWSMGRTSQAERRKKRDKRSGTSDDRRQLWAAGHFDGVPPVPPEIVSISTISLDEATDNAFATVLKGKNCVPGFVSSPEFAT